MFRAPLSSKKVGMLPISDFTVVRVESSEGNTQNKKSCTGYLMAFFEIFLLTVSARVFMLPKVMEPLNNCLLLGIGLTLLAGLIVLFSHYAILCASSEIVNTNEIKQDEDVFATIVNEQLKDYTCCLYFKYIFFDFTRWTLLCIYSVVYFEIITSYLNHLTGRPVLWLVIIVVAACMLTIMTLVCNKKCSKDDIRIKNFSERFKIIRRIILALASIVTIFAIAGIIYKYARRTDLNTFGSHLVSTPQDVVVGHDENYMILMCVGSIFPILCISFLNHMGSTSKLYEYIDVYNGNADNRFARRFVVSISQVVFILIYFAVPVIALLGNGGSVESNILLGLTESNDWIVTACQICSGFGVFVSLCFQYAPMLVQQMREFILKFKDDGDLEPKNMRLSHGLDVVLTLVILPISSYVAVLAPANLNIWLNLIGLPCASLIMLVFPSVIYLAGFWKENSLKDENSIYKGRAREICNELWRFLGCFCCCCICSLDQYFSELICNLYKYLFRDLSAGDRVRSLLSMVILVVGLVIPVLTTLWNVKQLMEIS
jgi:hypothetical protein